MTELKKKESSAIADIKPAGEAEGVAGSVAVKWEAMSFGQKCVCFVKNVTVEPTVLLYLLPRIFTSLATQNLYLEKACRVNLAYPDDVCDALSNRNTSSFKDEEIVVQQLVASMQTWKTPLVSVLPVIMILFIGAWSDRTGRRKPCMLAPIIGEFLTSITLLICTYWFYETSMEVTGVIEAIWPSITGGWFIMFVGAFSYVTDITSPESRMFRIGIVNVIVSAGLPMGTALSGVLYIELGFYGVFGIAAACYALSFVYCLMRVKEVSISPAMKQRKEAQLSGCGSVFDVFAIRHISDTFKTVFKNGPKNRRARIIVLMIIHMVIIGPTHGEMVMSYLFTRYKFNWNEVQYSIFSTYNMIANFAGMALSIWIFSYVWKIDDALLGIISCMSKILAAFVYAFATTDWMIYLAPLVECVNGAAYTSMRSISSKLVPKNELGKINSLFGVCEALMPLVYVPMYSSLYRATMNVLPGSFYLLGGGLTIPAAVLFLWLYIEHKGDKVREAAEVAVNKTDELNDNSETPNIQRGLDNPAFETERAKCL